MYGREGTMYQITETSPHINTFNSRPRGSYMKLSRILICGSSDWCHVNEAQRSHSNCGPGGRPGLFEAKFV